MIQINMNLVYNMINLIVLYLLLRHFLIRPVTQVMEKRRKMVEEGFQNARDMQNDALKMKQEYEAALSGAKQESVRIVEHARRTAKAEYDRIVSEAGEKAGSIIESAKETVRAEREKTMKELQSEIAGLAAVSAEKIMGKQTGAQGDAQLYEQFLKEAAKETDEGDNDDNRS